MRQRRRTATAAWFALLLRVAGGDCSSTTTTTTTTARILRQLVQVPPTAISPPRSRQRPCESPLLSCVLSGGGGGSRTLLHATTTRKRQRRRDGGGGGVLDVQVPRGGGAAIAGDDDDDDEEESQEEEPYDDDREEDDDDDDNQDDAIAAASATTTTSSSSSTSSLLAVLSRTARRVATATLRAAGRVLAAAVEPVGDDSNNASAMTLTQRVLVRLQRMVRAAFNASTAATSTTASAATTASRDNPEKEDEDQDNNNDDDRFGIQLAQALGVTATRYDRDSDDSASSFAPVLGGSFPDALERARREARLLVVLLLPSASLSKNDSSKAAALSSFLSTPVARVCEKPGIKKKNKSKSKQEEETTGSFLLWSALPGSPEAKAALRVLKKRGLQPPPGGSKNNQPVLAVVYPAQRGPATAAAARTATVAAVPQVLAQVQSRTALSSESNKLAAWLLELRKRHQKQLRALHRHRQERQWAQERAAGYRGSVAADREAAARAAQAQEEARQRVEAARQHEAAIAARRERLQRQLDATDEPAASDRTAKTVALRLGDGRAGQRRFAGDASLADVFNWVDAEFGLERETVTLVTLNGRQSFEWIDDDERSSSSSSAAAADDEDSDEAAALASAMPTLEEAGLGKMVGFRVIEKKASKGDDKKKQDDGDDVDKK